jgi:hypothetical protein
MPRDKRREGAGAAMAGTGRRGREMRRSGPSEGFLFCPAILVDLLTSTATGTTTKERAAGATETASFATRISESVGGCETVTTAKVSSSESFFSIGQNLRQ